MGADYLSGVLTAVIDRWDQGHPVPRLDWAAGHAYIDTLEVDQGNFDAVLCVFGEIEDSFNAFEDEEELDFRAVTYDYRKALHTLLERTQQTIEQDRRDVDWDVTGPLITYHSGGMSWGDAPTDALDVWWKWSDDDMPDGVYETLEHVGFIAPLGFVSCPYEIVPKAQGQAVIHALAAVEKVRIKAKDAGLEWEEIEMARQFLSEAMPR